MYPPLIFLFLLTTLYSFLVHFIRECSSTLYVGLAHTAPPTNTKFKPLLLLTQAGIPYTNSYKHRTSYLKSKLTFLGPAKLWKFISADRQKTEILAIFSSSNDNSQDLLFSQ